MSDWLDNTRLDRYLIRSYPDLSKGQIEKFLRQKDIRVNGQKAEGSYRLKKDDLLTISNFAQKIIDGLGTRQLKREIKLSDRFIDKMKNSIIWEDDDILVFNKPGGIAVQGGSRVRESLDDFLKKTYRQARLVHRIDKATSGILVVAKSLEIAQFLTEQFRLKSIEKTYWAIIDGVIAKKQGEIDFPIQSDEGRSFEGSEKEALTRYSVLKSVGKDMTWVELKPLTGRKHQLRIHMKQMGCPIIGDTKYGDYKQSKDLMLHAREIILPMPSGNRLTFTAEPPISMVNLFKNNSVNW